MDGVTEWKEYRNYEVSVWTLQDSYITTLKSGDSIYVADQPQPAIVWPQARAQGQIQNGKMVLNIDGTQTLNFDIPMYLFYNGERIENPNWYNIVDKNILTSMRKIKVIFDKWEDGDKSDKTFEFMIIKVQETHEKDELKCHVECEGLAFNELGKVGYKKSLSTQKFINESYEWANAKVGQGETYATQADKDAAEPVANLQYWMNEAGIEYLPSTAADINPTKWYYEIKMYYSSLDHGNNAPTSDKIYEQSYASDWTTNGIPTSYMEAHEKYRLVDIEESNLYNITQDLAEKFGVFCRYKYLYDTNYNIIGRVITFYNNFLQEDQDVTTLMYPNSASKITREMDSTDVSTKMFVRQVESAELYDGLISIMDCSANKTREDYVMNFDYLHDIGTISDEQYAAIPEFEKAIREINDKLIPLQETSANLSNLKIDADANITLLDNSIDLDQKQLDQTNKLLAALTEGDGTITRDYNNPDIIYLVKESDTDKKYKNSYYIKFEEGEKLGIDPSTIRIFKTYNTTNSSTYSYGLSFKKFAKPTTSKIINSSVPSSNALAGTDWVDDEFIYKGTIGLSSDKPDITKLPSKGTKNRGWVYKVISNSIYGSFTCKKGDLLYRSNTDSGWAKLSIDDSNHSKNGFYIYKRETVHQVNGLQTNIYTCTRYGADGVSTDYISKMRYVYYTTMTQNNSLPDAPTVEDAKTAETVIETHSCLDKWTTYESLPDDINSTFYVYASKEITYSSGKKAFIATKEVKQNYNYYGNNTSITAVKKNMGSAMLTDEITNGKFKYKPKTKILEKITGLFKNKTPDNPYVYVTYSYTPSLYYNELIDTWSTKKAKDMADRAYFAKRKEIIDGILEEAQDTINSYLDQKQELVAKFEHMMGAALRESYWQPEDEYQDYGKRYVETSQLSNIIYTKSNNNFSYIGWDKNIFEGEQELSYKFGVNQTLTYYPCIDLSAVSGFLPTLATNLLSRALATNDDDRPESYSVFFNPSTDTIPSGSNSLDVRYCSQYIIGSEAQLAFVVNNNTVKPVLILTGAESLTSNELINLQATASLGRLNVVEDQQTQEYHYEYVDPTYSIPQNAWLDIDENTYIVYPRILIPSLRLKTNNNDLVVQLENSKLRNYYDFQIGTKMYYVVSDTNNQLQVEDITNIENENISLETPFITVHTITIKPEALYMYGVAASSPNVKIYYSISNADVDIYLDALKIMKENAYPKVSYEIEVSMWSRTLLKNLYQKLAQIVMINDTDLKLKDTFGYISEVKLDLDHQENDTIDVKNYKTKFEDLFSKIVAETEEMHKNSYNIEMAGAIAASDSIDSDKLNNTLISNEDLLKQFLDNYLTKGDTFSNILSEMWTQAGSILADSANSLNQLSTIGAANALILEGFRENVSVALTPKVFTGEAQPTSFKPGDIWINGDYQSIATGYGDKGGGFTRTHDGTLAQITGASLDIDAEAGIIDINAGTEINLKSGQDINIAANDTVNIIGNKEVNIGGTTINIASANITDGHTVEPGSGGIHLVATTYTYSLGEGIEEPNEEEVNEVIEQDENYTEIDENNSTSRVDITGDGIEMASRNGIVIKSGAGIDIKSTSGDNENNLTSVVQIDKDKGIFIGADKGIKLFSGGLDGNAVIDLSSSHLILGANSPNNGTTISLDTQKIILAAGGITSGIIDGTSSGLVGVRIAKDSIGFATDSGNTINAILMNDKGITIGSGGLNIDQETTDLYNAAPSTSNYSFVRIAPSGIDISAKSYLKINTTNFVINSSATSGNPVLKLANNNTTALLYQDGTLSVNGAITATTLTVGSTGSNKGYLNYNSTDGLTVSGNITSSKLIAVQNTANPTAVGPIFVVTPNRMGFYRILQDPGNRWSNFLNGTSYSDYFEPLLYYDSTNNRLKITGDIVATNLTLSGSATIGGWSIGNNLLYSGGTTNNKYVGLSSDTSNSSSYAIWAGHVTASSAKFRVKRNGDVYLNSLMVYDPNSQITSDSNQRDGNYARVDFSQLNFNQAISVSLSWSGLTVTANASMWGKFSGSVSDSLTITPSTITVDSATGNGVNGSGSVKFTVGSKEYTRSGISCDSSHTYQVAWQACAQKVKYESGDTEVTAPSLTTIDGTRSVDITETYNKGWNDCRTAMINSATNFTYYTGTATSIVDNEGYSMNVIFPYVEHTGTRYTIPNQKT